METLFSEFFSYILSFSSMVSVKWQADSLMCLHNSASGIMFRIKKAKICTWLTSKYSETDSAFHIWFLNTSGKNHPTFLEKLLGNTCLTYTTAQSESFGQKLPSTQQNDVSVKHFPNQETFFSFLSQLCRYIGEFIPKTQILFQP